MTGDGALIHHWVVWMVAAGTPKTTIGLRRYYLARLAAGQSGLLGLGVEDLAGWLGAAGWAPNTMKSARSALRCFYGWAVATGRLPASPAHLLPAVRVPRGRPDPTPEDVYRAALEDADDRTRLILRLGGQCGLRRGEIVRVHAGDVEDALLGSVLRVVGKGGHTRLVPLPDDLAEQLRGAGGWVFPSPRGGHLTPHHVAKIAARALAGHRTHSLRHRAATRAYAGTHDLRAVQELLGHSRPETTAGYVLAPDDAVRAAMHAAA